MRAFVNDVEIPLHGMVVYDDLNQIYSTIEIVSPFYIKDSEVSLRSDKTLKCKIVRVVFENKIYRYTLISEKTWNSLNKNCSSFTGEADVNTLLSNIGVKNAVRIQSNKTFWIIPATKLKVVIRYLNRYSSIQSGGAPRFYIDIEGNLNCVDLKKAHSSNKPINMIGDVENDFQASDWIINNPGTVEIISYSKDGTRKRVVESGSGSGSVKINDTTGYSTELVVQRVKNEYNFNFYSSRKLNISNVHASSYELGTLVKLGNVDEKFIIFSRTVTIPIKDESPMVKLVLCAPCQKL